MDKTTKTTVSSEQETKSYIRWLLTELTRDWMSNRVSNASYETKVRELLIRLEYAE